MMSKMEIILEKQMVCHYENGLSSNGLSPHGIENIKKKSYLVFVLTTNHYLFKEIVFFRSAPSSYKNMQPKSRINLW